ncbi:uncharacterized mitochondrial protein AtMg01250-like [Rutidosis leptorrhynchoides]|uniref:uncharacterized mitochondrial protein AtMg01250-like n=1 Tax=Rutidosis leptorrhynchoides TaxID=125765 RepID=UPI003A99BDAC
MRNLGFGEKWVKWISSCLSSTSISVLVNGSPTTEFKSEKSVRQGEPISSLLFIIAAEGLNMMVKKAIDLESIKGVKVGRNGVFVSHLQYADDMILFGEWNETNALSIMKLLKCLALGPQS